MPRLKNSVTRKVEAVEVEAAEVEAAEVEAVETDNPEAISTTTLNSDNITPLPPTTMQDLVDQVLSSVRGYSAKFNNTKTLSVIDLASKGAHQGVTYRQLYVQAEQSYINVALRETFKSAHGGQEQTKTLSSFSVPAYETEPYGKLQSRFFGYSVSKNVVEGAALLDILRNTIS